MLWKLDYSASLVQCDNSGNPNGQSFTFSGQQIYSGVSPQTADLQTLATNMGADVSAKLVAGFPIQQAQDGDNASGGGAG